MRVILKENIDNLGNKGDIVNVAAGYGRNYLIPKKMALEVTASNKKMIDMEQAALKKHLEKARMSYQDVIQRLGSTTLSFVRKTAEKDVIFGSVSITDIKEELDKLGFAIEKKKILLTEPIKRLGNYSIPVKVFLDDKAEIAVHVISEEEAKKKGEEKTVSEAPQQEEKTEEGTLVQAGEKTEEETGGNRDMEKKEPDRQTKEAGESGPSQEKADTDQKERP